MKNQSNLHNIRVLDFTWVLAGPYATRLLADYGAEVIKIQPLLPPEEDNTFTRGYYETWNRNKLGITLNLAKPEGIELVKKLVYISDAVVENFTPHVMTNFGLDYENLKKLKPDIIMLSLSVMGGCKERSHYTGYAPTVHALSGLTSMMSAGGRPAGPGFSFSDHIAGLFGVTRLLEAMEHRRQTGQGGHIILSETTLIQDLLKDKPAAKYLEKLYRCKDSQWCAVTVEENKEHQTLVNAISKPVSSIDDLDKALEVLAREKTAAELMFFLRKAGITAGKIQDAASLANDPQLKARNFFKGTNKTFIDSESVKMDGRVKKNRPAPSPGRDNAYVYEKLLGLSRSETDSLHNSGVV